MIKNVHSDNYAVNLLRKIKLFLLSVTLNFPQYSFRIRKNERGAEEIFDRVRKKFVSLTPEEWVRQHLLEFLIREKEVPQSLIAVEKQLKLNSTLKRTDVLVYTNTLQPLLIAECKAPDIVLDEKTMNQALRYNLVYKVPFLLLTNGQQHYFFSKVAGQESWKTEADLPVYNQLIC